MKRYALRACEFNIWVFSNVSERDFFKKPSAEITRNHEPKLCADGPEMGKSSLGGPIAALERENSFRRTGEATVQSLPEYRAASQTVRQLATSPG